MPGKLGPRHSDGAPDASDALHRCASDAPYGRPHSLPVPGRTVGAPAYFHVNDSSKRSQK